MIVRSIIYALILSVFICVGSASAYTEGWYNNFFGVAAGMNNYGVNYNTFIGGYSGFSNTTGEHNTFTGYGTGNYNTVGDENSFYGYEAGMNNTTGFANTFVGSEAGQENTTGGQNTFNGRWAGHENTTGYDNTFIGSSTGRSNTTGSTNTFIGSLAGYNSTTSHNNIFIGGSAGRRNTTGFFNTFIGSPAGSNNTTGSKNIYIGSSAGSQNISGEGNVFLGHAAGFYETGSNRLFIDNSNTSSPLIYGEFDNDILGFNAKVGIGTTSPNTLLHVAGSGTIGNGFTPGAENDDNILNLVVGANSNGKSNGISFMETESGFGMGIGYDGTGSGDGNKLHIYSDNSVDTTARVTVEHGGRVGIGLTDPSSKLTVAGTIESTSGGIKFPDGTTMTSTAGLNAETLGGQPASAFAAESHSHSGTDITSGTVAEARIDAAIARDSELTTHTSRTDNPHSVTAAQIGAADTSHNHDTDYINVSGDTMNGDLLVYGTVDIDQNLYVVGNIYAESDARSKKDIKPIDSSLNKIRNIQGVTYAWKSEEKNAERKHYGVIAQEVEKVIPEIVTTGSNGKKKVAYMELIPVLIEAVKEQQRAQLEKDKEWSRIIQKQQKTINALHEKLDELERVVKLKDSLASVIN